MTIVREAGRMQRVCCNVCGDEHPDEYDQANFGAMIAQAKEDGWEVKLEAGDWVHHCPEHAGISGGTASPRKPREPRAKRTSKLEAQRKLLGL